MANKVLAAALVSLGAVTVLGQAPTVRHHRTADSEVSQSVAEAETAIDSKDYAKAQSLLTGAVKRDAKDSRAWFDLGLVYSATNQKDDAIDAYQKSVSAKPDFFESNLNLGLLLASGGKSSEAAPYLRAATELKPSDPAHAQAGAFLAWYSLAKVLEGTSPGEALDAYQHASALQPEKFEPHLAQAELLEKSGHFKGAEGEYQKATQINPKSEQALRGLTNVYIAEGKLPEAQKALQDYLQLNPASAQAHLQLARIDSTAKKYDDALAELQAAQKLDPESTEIQRELAGNAALRGDYPLAETEYRSLLKSAPQDPDLHYALGTALMNDRKFPESESELVQALKLNPRLAEAYGNLATAAAENNHYALAIKALDARAALLPENAGSYFLRASCLDHLKQYKKAAENYRLFLSVSNGKFPNQEWQAQHRLMAIDPK